MVERILLQDRELWSQPGFAYATKTNNTGRNQGRRSYSPTSYKMASKMTLLQPVLGAGAQSNRQLKYEIIERLLRTPDTDVTSRTLKEMMKGEMATMAKVGNPQREEGVSFFPD